MLGLAQGAFSLSVPYAYTRNQFQQPIGTFQGMAFSFAEAATRIETAKLLTYNAARRKEAGMSFTKEAAMAKWWSSKVAQEVSGNAIEWMGGLGFTRETGVEKFWRDSKIVSLSFSFRFIVPFHLYAPQGAIYEGTSNIQLQTIARFIQKEYTP